jgi:hypothetical protein
MDLLKMSDITERPIDWTWRPYVPAGKISSISGELNSGKSQLAAAIIAAVTGGHAMPGQESANEPIQVLLQTPGDWLSDVVMPRLTKCGANCDMIHIAPLELGYRDSDLRILERIIKGIGAKLFVVDPWDLYLHNANDEEIFSYVRGLSYLAASTNCAVVIVGDELPPLVQEIVHSLVTVGPEDGEDKYLRGFSHMKPILGENMGTYSEEVFFRIHPEDGFQWLDFRDSPEVEMPHGLGEI